MKISLYNDRLEFSGIGDQADLLRVKQIPGRYYDDEGRWIVPIFPGLADVLDRPRFGFVGLVILAALEEREAAIRKSVEPPPVTPYLMENISAIEALERAAYVRYAKAEWKRKGQVK